MDFLLVYILLHENEEFFNGAGGGVAGVEREFYPGCEEVGDVHGHGGECVIEHDQDRFIILGHTEVEVDAIEALMHRQGYIIIQSGIVELNGEFGGSVGNLNGGGHGGAVGDMEVG